MGSRTIAEDVIALAMSGPDGRAVFGEIADALMPPWEGNNVPLAHSALGEVMAGEIKANAATIYVFDEAASVAAGDLIDTGNPRRRALAGDLARWPADRCWLEIPESTYYEGGTIAFFCRCSGDVAVIDVIVRLTGGKPYLSIQFDWSLIDGRLYLGPQSRPVAFEVRRYRYHYGKMTLKLPNEDKYPLALMALCAFLAVGGATVTVPERRPVKVGRGAAQKTIGFLTVGKTRLALPAGCAVRASGEKHGPGVRFHDVRGHYREVSVGGQKMLRFIAAFWRGNPRLGIVVKHRQVTT